MASEAASAAEPVVVPVLRGWIHLAALPGALSTGLLLVGFAANPHTRMAAIAFTASISLIFMASAMLHRGPFRHNDKFNRWVQRCDHSAIYLAMGGIYTAYWMVTLDGGVADLVLWVVWVGAGLGILKKLFWLHAPRWVSSASYIVLGLTGTAAIPQLLENIGGFRTSVLALSGVLFMIGAAFYSMQWPRRDARYFGYHELFHLLTVIALGMQFSVFASCVLR
jgi:hemolysin III